MCWLPLLIARPRAEGSETSRALLGGLIREHPKLLCPYHLLRSGMDDRTLLSMTCWNPEWPAVAVAVRGARALRLYDEVRSWSQRQECEPRRRDRDAPDLEKGIEDTAAVGAERRASLDPVLHERCLAPAGDQVPRGG